MKRKLGRSKIEISALGMGCWAIGGLLWAESTPVGWGEVDDNESIKAIQACIAHGVNFFDTANVYGAGHSESVLGRALDGRRDKVVIATKFGYIADEETRQFVDADASPVGIRQQLEDSLQRLNTDYIDLYQFHINDHPVEEAEPVRDTLEALVQEGKIRCYGWSTVFPERAEFFVQGEHCSAIQIELNVLKDNAALIEICEASGQAAILRAPLAMGLLTGKYKVDSVVGADDVRSDDEDPENIYFKDSKPAPDIMERVAAVREILQSDGRTLVQGALAWLWGRSDITIPIPGIRTVAQAEENCKAMEFGALNADQMEEIKEVLGRA